MSTRDSTHRVTAVLFVLLACAPSHTRAPEGSLFSSADAYQRFMGRWSMRLAPDLLRFAGVHDHDAVLDVGCGTGALAFAAAHLTTGPVTGIDPSADSVRFATTQSPAPRLHFEVGDAQHLQLPTATFDQTLALLVINFIPDAEQAVRELKRVTKPGGVVSAAVWDYAEGMQMLRVFWDEAVALDPAVAARDERTMPWCRRGELATLWRAQGLTQVEEQTLSLHLHFGSFDDYWAPFLLGQGPAGAYAKSLSPERRAALEQRLRQRLLGGGADRPFDLEARAWAVRGVVP
jgi:SAM-dependent methyltransferase